MSLLSELSKDCFLSIFWINERSTRRSTKHLFKIFLIFFKKNPGFCHAKYRLQITDENNPWRTNSHISLNSHEVFQKVIKKVRVNVWFKNLIASKN